MNVDSTKPVDYVKIYIKIISITLFGKKHHLLDPVYIKSLCTLYSIDGASAVSYNLSLGNRTSGRKQVFNSNKTC